MINLEGDTYFGFSWFAAPAAALKPVGSKPFSTPDAMSAPQSCRCTACLHTDYFCAVFGVFSELAHPQMPSHDGRQTMMKVSFFFLHQRYRHQTHMHVPELAKSAPQ